MADKRISQLIERTDIANNDVLPIVASGATTTNKVTISTIQDWMQENLDVGVTSVGLSMPSAFTVSNSPITTSGNISVSGAGTTAQYIRGDGSLADFPSSTGGGSSVSYYLNGSVNQGTIGGIAYRELSKSAILGAGTDFTINADGYIASFITDAGDPNLLLIPAGNWNFETYLQASSGGGTPTFYIELYKVSGSTATLIASNSGSPELIAFGTNINPYFSALAVPETTLLLTDRLAIRYYVTHSGRTITLHTENNTLCQIITTFTTGLTALNGLTAQVQNLATGTSGTDFNISSASTTHTFNLPTASATNRGALSSADWITFNAKQPAGNYVTLDTTQSITATKSFITGGGGNTLTVSQTSGSGIALNITKFGNGEGLKVEKFSGTGNAATIIGGLLSTEGISSTAPSNAISLLLNGRSADNVGIIAFGANTGGGQYNFIQASPTSLIVGSRGNTPLEFHTNVNGGGGPRMTIAGSGGVTFTNGITTTSAVLTSVLQGVNANFSGLIETSDSVRIGTTASVKHSNTGFTLSGFNNIHGNIDGFVVQNQTKGFRINFPSNAGFTHTLPDASGTIALASQLGAYLPLAGGTLTGALNGTSASFNGNIISSNTSGAGLLGISGSQAGAKNYIITNVIPGETNTGLAIRNTTDSRNELTFSGTGAATFSSSVQTGGNVLIPAGSRLAFVGDTNRFMTPEDNIQGARIKTPGGFVVESTGATFSSSVDARGDVTIGSRTADSDSKLEFANGTDTQVRIIAQDFTTDGRLGFWLNQSGVGFVERMVIKRDTGNVGIGTASPSRNLHVLGASGVGTVLKLEGGSGATTYLQLSYNGATNAQSGYIGYDTSSNMPFFTNDTERMRITSGGFLKASNNGTYYGSTGGYHEIRSNLEDWTNIVSNTNASPYGIFIQYTSASPNGISNEFLTCRDGGLTVRAVIRSNGGLSNYQANDTNLSDERTKKDIEPLESYWDKFKAIEIVKFKYKDQTHDDFNIGVIAQQVESVAPEFVDVDGWVDKPELDQEGNEIVTEEEPLKSIYTADLHHATIKVLQEAMAKIEKLEIEISSLKNQIK